VWIFCCGMQRSGSTLQFQIAADLVENAGLGKRVEWIKSDEFPEIREKHAEYTKWKVFKNHVLTDEMRTEFDCRHAMGVYVFRDLRDVIVSAMKKYSMSFNELWDSDFLGECLTQFDRWTSLPSVLVSKYEDVVVDLPAEVERIAFHLGIKPEADELRRIAAEYAMEKQKQRIQQARQRGGLKQGVADGSQYDPYSNLHSNHIQSGAIDEWKNHLSLHQVALIEDRARDWLVAHGYTLSSTASQRQWHRLWDKISPRSQLRRLFAGIRKSGSQ